MRGRLRRVGLRAVGACGLLRREERLLLGVCFAARIGRGVRLGRGSRISRSRLGSSRLGFGRPGLGMRGVRIRGGGRIDMVLLVGIVGRKDRVVKRGSWVFTGLNVVHLVSEEFWGLAGRTAC